MTDELPPVVLIHGLWMTPKSWDGWVDRYRRRGHEVLAPGWPGIGDRSVADVRADPSALRGVGLRDVTDHYDAVIRALPRRPVVMGHSFGGVIAQMLADRGLGVACVGVETGQTAGVRTIPWSTLRTGAPVLSNPFVRNGASPISKRHFHYTFGNDLTRAESDEQWEQYAVPSGNRVLFDGVTSVLNGRSGASRVDYARADRPPLLVVAGGADHVVPPAIGRALVARYRASGGPAVVELREYDGRTHRILTQDGWEEVADDCLAWAMAHAHGRA